MAKSLFSTKQKSEKELHKLTYGNSVRKPLNEAISIKNTPNIIYRFDSFQALCRPRSVRINNYLVFVFYFYLIRTLSEPRIYSLQRGLYIIVFELTSFSIWNALLIQLSKPCPLSRTNLHQMQNKEMPLVTTASLLLVGKIDGLYT